MTKYRDLIDALKGPTRDLRAVMPEVWAEFSDLHQEAVSEGVLPARIKEIIALAIAVADGCDGCIAYHARGAAQRGASEPEVVEALGVALLMAGGPASVNAPKALEAFREFATAGLVTAG